RLGWSHGDDEIISTEQAIQWFDFAAIGKSAARMDFKKLDNLNGHYIRARSDEALLAELAAFLERRSPPHCLSPKARARLGAAMPLLKERAKTLVALDQGAEFLYTDGARVLDPSAARLLSPEARARLSRIVPLIEATDFSSGAIEKVVRSFAQRCGLKLADAAQPLRAALTGTTVSPPIFEMLSLLGREESLIRLRAYATG
ncbi:MAG: glutamate--tRNA ligase, partial [Rhizomicrobium sp.]